jgi:hypothetical protein
MERNLSAAKCWKNSPGVPQKRCFKLVGISSGKVQLWAGNGSCVDDICKRYEDIILECIKRYVAQKILSKNSDPEYYNKEVKRLIVKVRKIYNKRKFGQPYQAELKRLSKELLVA